MKPESDNSCKTSTLAPVQRQTLEYLRNFVAEYGYAPSLKQIALNIGVKSASTAHFHLERLEQKGFIRRGEDGTIEIVEISAPELSSSSVQLVGTIAAGSPIEAVERPTNIEIPSWMINKRGEVYCLEVSGDSMIEDHICDGDIVVIRKQTTADDGETVVALLQDNTATLKRFRRLKNGKVMLIPANSQMQPITADGVTIQGVLVGVLRHLH